jgi:type IV pilus assembly protein PilM
MTADTTEALLRELRDRVQEPLDEWVVDYLPVRPDGIEGGERDAIVAMARREAVVRYLDTLRGAGLDPLAVDVGPAALARLFSLPNATRGYDNVLIVNFGRSRSFLTVVWGRRLMFDREVAFGETLLARRLAAALGLDEASALALIRQQGFHVSGKSGAAGEEADLSRTITEILRGEFAGLAAEINRTLLYTASRTRGKSVDRASLLGSVARHPGSGALLESLISVPVEICDPFTHFPAAPGVDTGRVAPSEMALAAGLALRGLAPDDGD